MRAEVLASELERVKRLHDIQTDAFETMLARGTNVVYRGVVLNHTFTFWAIDNGMRRTGIFHEGEEHKIDAFVDMMYHDRGLAIPPAPKDKPWEVA